MAGWHASGSLLNYSFPFAFVRFSPNKPWKQGFGHKRLILQASPGSTVKECICDQELVKCRSINNSHWVSWGSMPLSTLLEQPTKGTKMGASTHQPSSCFGPGLLLRLLTPEYFPPAPGAEPAVSAARGALRQGHNTKSPWCEGRHWQYQLPTDRHYFCGWSQGVFLFLFLMSFWYCLSHLLLSFIIILWLYCTHTNNSAESPISRSAD